METYISNKKQKISAFTIVELLIVIVIIGILAAITIVSYRGITQRSVEASLQADLSNASKKLKIFQVDNNAFPATIRCDVPDSNTNLCLKSNSGNTFDYTYDNTSPQSFNLKASNSAGTITYRITNTTGPVAYTSLDAPSSFTSVGGFGQSVLTWVAPSSTSSITNYKIYRSTTSGGETLLTTVGNVLTYTDTGLTAGTVYYYKVLAVNADGDGTQSSESSSMPLLSFNNTSTGQTGTIQNWTVPVTGTYTIEANGAQGGSASSYSYVGGLGARMKGDISLTAGTVLKILVGQMGLNYANAGGGGGGTFVAKSDNTALVVAGGGGGVQYSLGNGVGGTTGTSGVSGTVVGGSAGAGGNGYGPAGGAGFTGNGTASTYGPSPLSFINGGTGGAAGTCGSGAVGGFGGGSGAEWCQYGSAGAGGGYSGGGGGSNTVNAGGGGSYNSGTNQSNTAGARSGQGLVTIVK